MSFTKTLALLAILLTGCATAPQTRAERENLRNRAETTIQEMTTRNPAIADAIRNAPAYAVFPSVGKGGVLVGGAYGKGILYEGGRASGYVSLQQASLGAQLGGQSFAELLLLRTPGEIADVKSGRYSVGADASAVILTAGAAGSTTFDPNTTVFVMPRGGLMVDISISGQQLKYQSFSA